MRPSTVRSAKLASMLAALCLAIPAHAAESWSEWFYRHVDNAFAMPAALLHPFGPAAAITSSAPLTAAQDAARLDLYRRFRAARLVDSHLAVDLAHEYSRL